MSDPDTQDLEPHARLLSDYAIELADSLNEDLASEDSDWVFVYVVHDSVYLCKYDDEGTWRYEGEFEEAGGDVFEATNRVAQEIDDGWLLADIPGSSKARFLVSDDD